MKCSFCGEDITIGSGKMFVKNDGRVLYFCSKRCEKCTFKLNRKPHTSKWTATYNQQKKSKAEEKEQ